MDSSFEINVGSIEGALAALSNPATTQAARLELENNLTAFKGKIEAHWHIDIVQIEQVPNPPPPPKSNPHFASSFPSPVGNPSSWEFALACLCRVLPSSVPYSPPHQPQSRPSESMQFYCASILDHVSTPRLFDTFPSQFQSRLLTETHDALLQVHAHLYNSALVKLISAYARLGRCSVTEQDASFLVDALNLLTASTPSVALLGSRVFATICEEFPSSTPSSPLSGSQYLTVQRTLLAALPSFGVCLLVPLTHHREHPEVVRHCLLALSAVLSFPTNHDSKMMSLADVSLCVTVELVTALFQLAQPGGGSRAAALECVNEVVRRNCWPGERAVECLMAVTTNAAGIVQKVAEGMEGGEGIGDEDEGQ